MMLQVNHQQLVSGNKIGARSFGAKKGRFSFCPFCKEETMLEKCTICPHKCGIDRTKNIGRCKSTDKIKIALYSVHNFEEPCISGEKGSATIFFCNSYWK